MDITGDGDSDADTDVYCIDDDTYLNDDGSAYTETDMYVGEVLQNEGGNFGTGEDAVDANAAEILAMTATGASDGDNQDAVWDIIEDDTPPAGSTVEDIVDATVALASEFVFVYGEDATHEDLVQFLDDRNVNELEVVLDADPLIDDVSGDYNEFVASAIMENPLVPGVTDENKTVTWYILEGSYNVSFAPDSLVTEITSIMTDEPDDGTNGIDFDTDLDTVDDTYGLATQQYYFFWWGAGYAEYEEMNVCLFAWVDIDDDSKLDITDLPGDEALEEGALGYKDGDVVGEFMEDHQVVDAGDVTKTAPVVDESGMDICESEGGKVMESAPKENPDDCGSGHWTSTWQDATGLRWWDCDYNNHDGFYNQCQRDEYQRFVIENYSESYADACELYSAWGTFDLYKGDSKNPSKPVEGATYVLKYIEGQCFAPSVPEYTMVTDASGKASLSGLPWGKWELTETIEPSGYEIDLLPHVYLIGGSGLKMAGSSVNVNADVVNVPKSTPGPDPEPEPTPEPEGTITVAGITSGIQVLAFTGIAPIIPISGGSALAGGLSLFIASLIKRNRKK